MRLYLSGWEEVLVEEALKLVAKRGGEKEAEGAKKLLDRMETCRELQKPHKPT